MTRLYAAVFIILFAVWIDRSNWLNSIDMHLLDAEFKFLRQYFPHPIKQDVVIVGFDDVTSTILREPFTLWHSHLADFLQASAKGNAAAVGLDVILPDRNYDFIFPDSSHQLLAGILTSRRTTPIVFGLTVDHSGSMRGIYPPYLTAAGKDGVGYAILPQDEDGVIRRFSEHIGEEGNTATTLVGQMARRLDIPVKEGFINYGSGDSFDFIPLQDVLAWYRSGDVTKLQTVFSGKAIMLGGTYKYEDRLLAPVNLTRWDPNAINVPGVLLHAQALRNLLNDGLIHNINPLITLALTIVAAFLFLWAPSIWIALASICSVILFCFFASLYSLSVGMFIPIAQVIFISTLSISGRQIIEITNNLLERRRLRHIFGGYVSPSVMKEIIAGNLNPTLGGVKQFGCLLFSDIRGYTTLSEKLTPEDTVTFVNDYFDRVVPIIHEFGGTVICFMGDGIMAAFGIPQACENPSSAAFECAKKMLENLKSLNKELLMNNSMPIDIGIGLHAGEGIAGHIGASSRHEYSIIGDVVNVASRLEGLSKEVGFRVVCSNEVFKMLDDTSDLIPLGLQNIKGRSSVEVYGYEKI